jgi:transcriptional regulator with XRE-family HTH domain
MTDTGDEHSEDQVVVDDAEVLRVVRRFARRMHQARMDRGMTQRELSKAAGLSLGQVYRIERWRHDRDAKGETEIPNPNMHTLWAIADGLGVDLRTLLAEEE